MTKNLTVGKPARLILSFTIPLFIGNVFQQLYSFADASVVGRTIGVDALAAVGATGNISFLLIGFAQGMTAGFAIPVAHAYGAGDHDAVRRSAATGTVLTGAFGVLITAIAIPLARPLLQLLRTPPQIIDDSTLFLQVSFTGTIAVMFFNFLGALCRALGDSRTPLLFLAFSCVLNVVLVFALVAGVGMNVDGASLATVISQAVSVVLCLWYIRRRMPILRMHRADWRMGMSDIRHHLRLGVPMGFQMSIIAIGGMAVQFSLNELGPTAVAAFTAAGRVDSIAVAPLGSFGAAIAMFAAQNRGALAYHRIRVGVAQTAAMAAGIAVLAGTVNVLFGPDLIRLFVGGSASDVVALGHTYLTINGVLYIALGMLFVLRNALQGLGNTLIPTMSGVGELVGRIVAGLVLAPLLGFAGAALASPAAWLAALIPLCLSWTRQRRKLIMLEREQKQLRQIPLVEPVVIGVVETDQAEAAAAAGTTLVTGLQTALVEEGPESAEHSVSAPARLALGISSGPKRMVRAVRRSTRAVRSHGPATRPTRSRKSRSRANKRP